MIINNNIHAFSNLYTANAVVATKQSSNASRNQKIRSFQDEMVISKEAQSFKDMIKKLQNESEVRQEKVEQYSRMIESGNYDIGSENIAASIISSRF